MAPPNAGTDSVGTDSAGSDSACPPGHAGLAAELRAVTLVALDRLQPVLARLRAATDPAPDAACPVCAVLATVRGEHPELAGRLARHATGLAAALREALDDPGPAAPAPPARPVQHIPVDRDGSDRGRGTGGGAPC